MAWAIPLLLLISWLQRGESRRPLQPKGWLAGLVFALNLFLWHLSIDYIGAGLATVLANTQVIFIALLGWLFLAERPSRTALMLLPLLFAGVVLLTGLDGPAYGSNRGLGVVFGLLSGLTSATYVLVFRSSSRELEPGSPPVGLLLQTTTAAAVAGLLLGAALDPGFSVAGPLSAHIWLSPLAPGAQVAGGVLLGRAVSPPPALETAL